MKNFIDSGASITVTAPSGGLTGGSIVPIGEIIGVAVATAAEGELCAVQIKGSYSDIPKVTGTAFTQGDMLYWDGTAMTKTATSNTFAGYAYADAASGDAVCSVLLSH